MVVGVEQPQLWTAQDDVIQPAALTTASICAARWPNNPGHVLIVPNAHFENLFELPADYAAAIHVAAQRSPARCTPA